METDDRRESVETLELEAGEAPSLHDGQRLDQATFHELYSRTSGDFRAELIDGVVYTMNMPLYADHGGPTAEVIGVLFNYKLATPGTIVHCEVTTRLAPQSEVQPDAVLQIDPAFGGRTLRDANGATINAPELVIEVSVSSLRVDLNQKKKVYEEAGAPEYVVFDVDHGKFHWFTLVEGRLLPLDPVDGVFRSRAFPGLWVDGAAFVAGDLIAVMETLHLGLASREHAEFVARLAEYRADRP